MNPYRSIVRTYRRLDSLFTRPDNHKTLTCQSSDKNDAPRNLSLDPLQDPDFKPGDNWRVVVKFFFAGNFFPLCTFRRALYFVISLVKIFIFLFMDHT